MSLGWPSHSVSRINFLLMGAQVMLINKSITVSLRRFSMTHSKLETSLDNAPVRMQANPMATQLINCLHRVMKSLHRQRTLTRHLGRESPLILSHQQAGRHFSQLQRTPMSKIWTTLRIQRVTYNWYRQSSSMPWGVCMSRLCQSTSVVRPFITSAASTRSQAVRWAQS